MTDTNKKLRRLAKARGLTYPKIAELAGAGTKLGTVEGWMARPGTVSFRKLPAWRLELIEVRLQLMEANGSTI